METAIYVVCETLRDPSGGGLVLSTVAIRASYLGVLCDVDDDVPVEEEPLGGGKNFNSHSSTPVVAHPVHDSERGKAHCDVEWRNKVSSCF